jgi:hypothetical protein
LVGAASAGSLDRITSSTALVPKERLVPASLSPSDTLSIASLRAAVGGRVIAPDDDGYDEARTVYSGAVDSRPAVIVRVADATDVARVVALARETGLERSSTMPPSDTP